MTQVILNLGHPDFRLQVHGGAWDIPESLKQAHRIGVGAAYRHAVDLYSANTDPLDIVVSVLTHLENDPVFDAGFGSFLNENGEVELDAAVMEGASLRGGAVAALPAFANPSQIALQVLKKTEHVLLVGEGAKRFACAQGFLPLQAHELVHPREVLAHKNWVLCGKPSAKNYFASAENGEATGSAPERRGTVGVVLGIKKSGGAFNLYAGTSTGGTPGKIAGRVGDVPLLGAGIYADNEGACVSCTGWGEGLMRIGAAKAVSEKVSNGMHPQRAIECVLQSMFRRTGGRGGIIAMNAKGECGAGFTTPDMAFAGEFCAPIDVSCECLANAERDVSRSCVLY